MRRSALIAAEESGFSHLAGPWRRERIAGCFWAQAVRRDGCRGGRPPRSQPPWLRPARCRTRSTASASTTQDPRTSARVARTRTRLCPKLNFGPNVRRSWPTTGPAILGFANATRSRYQRQSRPGRSRRKKAFDASHSDGAGRSACGVWADYQGVSNHPNGMTAQPPSRPYAWRCSLRAGSWWRRVREIDAVEPPFGPARLRQ
jgi:hypothetical protein